MKTFKEFSEDINENFDGEGFLFDTPEEAEKSGLSLGLTGYHEHNGKFMAGNTHEDFMFAYQSYKKKTNAGLDLT